VCVAFRLPAGVAPADLPPLQGGARFEGGKVVVDTLTPTELLHELTGWAMTRGIELEHLTVNQPSLEDVYLELTTPTDDAG
jgi:ABC-2 type transport system ATP-binding protein